MKTTFLKSLPSPPGPQSLCRHRWTLVCTDGRQASRLSLPRDRCAALKTKTNMYINHFILCDSNNDNSPLQQVFPALKAL